jgi:hypothetical protein
MVFFSLILIRHGLKGFAAAGALDGAAQRFVSLNAGEADELLLIFHEKQRKTLAPRGGRMRSAVRPLCCDVCFIK